MFAETLKNADITPVFKHDEIDQAYYRLASTIPSVF